MNHPQDTTSLPAALAATPPARNVRRRGLSPEVWEERLAFIRAGIARGETQEKIGAALGISDARVCQICAKHRIKPAGVAVSQYTPEMRSRYMKAAWADPATRKALLLNRREHSKETVRTVVSLRGQKSAAQIAREMGFSSRNVVIGIWNRSSVPFSAPVSPPFPGAARPAEVPCRPAGRADLSQLMQAMAIQPDGPAHDWFAAAVLCGAVIASVSFVGAVIFSAVERLF